VSWGSLEHAAIPVERLQNSQAGVCRHWCHDYSELEVLRPGSYRSLQRNRNIFSVASAGCPIFSERAAPRWLWTTSMLLFLGAVHLAMVSLRNRESDVAGWRCELDDVTRFPSSAFARHGCFP